MNLRTLSLILLAGLACVASVAPALAQDSQCLQRAEEAHNDCIYMGRCIPQCQAQNVDGTGTCYSDFMDACRAGCTAELRAAQNACSASQTPNRTPQPRASAPPRSNAASSDRDQAARQQSAASANDAQRRPTATQRSALRPRRQYLDPQVAMQCIRFEHESDTWSYIVNSCSIKLFVSWADDGHCRVVRNSNTGFGCSTHVEPHSRALVRTASESMRYGACEYPYGARAASETGFRCSYPR